MAEVVRVVEEALVKAKLKLAEDQRSVEALERVLREVKLEHLREQGTTSVVRRGRRSRLGTRCADQIARVLLENGELTAEQIKDELDSIKPTTIRCTLTQNAGLMWEKVGDRKPYRWRLRDVSDAQDS